MKAEKNMLTIPYPGILILSAAPPETIELAAAPTEAYKTITLKIKSILNIDKCFVPSMFDPVY